jgi:uncharacterized protein involved in exopolysaccharide biosynthesis
MANPMIPPANTTMDLKALFRRVFVVVALLITIVSVAITFILPETYASTARIKVVADETPVDGTTNGDMQFLVRTFGMIQSERVLGQVIDRLNLSVEWGVIYFAGQTLKPEEALDILKGRLRVVPVGGPGLIAITFYDEDPKEAARIANAVAESYRDYRTHKESEPLTQVMAALGQKYAGETTAIELQQVQLEALRKRFGIGTNDVKRSEQSQPYWQKKSGFQRMLAAHQTTADELAATKAELAAPKPALVQIVDRAVPGRGPVRPNKILYISFGALGGIFLGLVLGGAAVTVARRGAGPIRR